MKLKKMTIHNIASIEDAVIDFEAAPLCEEFRFLICGPTGSGKSTLLDAICLALFGTTPRLENAANESYTDKYDNFKSGAQEAVRTDDPRMLMRRGALDASAELLFTDKDDGDLKSVWSCRRARGRVDGTIQDWNLVLYDSDGAVLSSRKSETKRLIMERIGLSFEQFCRTTMLAQGDFTRFLKSNESEKSEILEKLTGTEIYSSISRRIHELYTEKEGILREIQAQVDNAVLLAPEEREKIISERQDLVNKIGYLKVKEKYWSVIRDWLKKSKDLDAEVLHSQNELDGLKVIMESPEFITKKKLVEDWDRSEKIRMLRNGIAHQKGIITTKENSEKETQGVYESIMPGVASFENSLEKVKEQKSEADLFLESESDKRELYAQKQLIENCIRQIMADNADVDRLQQTVLESQKSQEKYRLELSTHEKQLKSLNNQMERINGMLSEKMNNLTAMNYEEMLVRRHGVAEKVKELKLLKELYEKYSRNGSEYNTCKNKVERGKEDIAAYKGKLKSVKNQERVAQEELSSLRSLYNKQKLGCDDLIKEYRSRLAEGDTCPLCGQIIRGLIQDTDFQSILSPTEERLNTLQTESDKIHHLVADVNALLESAEDARKENIKECEKCYKAYSESIKEYEGHPLYGQYASCPSPMETLNSDIKVKEELGYGIELDFSKYGRISNEVSSIQNEKEACSVQLENCNATITKQKDQIKDCQHTIDQSLEGIEKNRKHIEENRITLSRYADPDVCMEQGESYIETLQQAARRFNEITEKSWKLGEQVIQMTSDMEQIRNSMDSILEIHPDWKISLQNCPDVPTVDISPAKLNLLQVRVAADHTSLQNSRNELIAMEEESQRYFGLEDSLSLERIEELLTKSDTEEINEIRNYLRNFEINFSTVGNKLENLKKDQKEHEALRPEMKEETAPEIIKAELDETEKTIDLCNQQLGTADERLQQDENNREKYKSICMNLENARQEFERWMQLHTLFGSADGKKFRNIAQSYILDMLLHSANHYLNSFSERYEMVCEPGSLTILLKDKAAGGVVRPSTTISGGESFLVSLSLALGLSSLSRASISMDTLFIDEGFGTLDNTCLSTIMDALERLHRMNGKRIGIISHVDSLRERIPAQIQLIRVNSTLSRVEVRNLV